MNPKPLDAGLAERLKAIHDNPAYKDGVAQGGFGAVAKAVRKIVKEAKEGE